MGVATATYGADFNDLIYGFNWQGSPERPSSFSSFSDLNGATNDLTASAYQAVDIIRRRTGLGAEVYSRPSGWIPHVLYSHLVLLDYLAARMPERLVVSSGDRIRLLWQQGFLENPLDPSLGGEVPLPAAGDAPAGAPRRVPHSASFQIVPASYDRFQSVIGGQQRRIYQGPQHSTYFVPQTPPNAVSLRGARLGDVQFPSEKVKLHDSHSRHFGDRQLYYAYPESRVPLAFFDASVRVRTTSDSFPGWNAAAPIAVQSFQYQPANYEPPTRSGLAADRVIGHYRWTASGLRGKDFGGGGDIDLQINFDRR
jgi:hypothetical protein